MIFLLFLFIKGEWVIRWEIPNEKSAIKIINEAKKEGFNTLFIQTYARGEVLYPSTTFPRFEELKTHKDLLGFIINYAHRNGISVHLWINLFYAWSQAPFPHKYKHLVYRHPDWFLVDKNHHSMLKYSVPELKRKGLPGYFLSPFAEGIIPYFKELITEILTRYNPDGIQFDYVRFPDKGLDYGKDIETAFMRKYYIRRNDPLMPFIGENKIRELWEQEKTKRISAIIDTLSQTARSLKPDIIISAACIPDINEAKSHFSQNWVLWLNRGYIDYAIPMLYTNNYKWFKRRLKKYRGLKQDIIPGIGGYLMQTREELLNQENLVKSEGFPGFVVFSAENHP